MSRVYTLTLYNDQPGQELEKTEIITSEPGLAALDVLRGLDLLEGVFSVDPWELDLTTLPGPSVLSVAAGKGKLVIVGCVRSKHELAFDAMDPN